MKEKNNKHICSFCGGEFTSNNGKNKYCSYKCSNGAKSVKHKRNCFYCGKKFETNNIAEIKRGHAKFCSNECRVRKYSIDEDYFNYINDKSAYWLGFIWASGYVKSIIELRVYHLDKISLEFMNSELRSIYPIIKSTENYFYIKFRSKKIIEKFFNYGLSKGSKMDNESPVIDPRYYWSFLTGYIAGSNIKKNDILTISFFNKEICMWANNLINGKIYMSELEYKIDISYEEINNNLFNYSGCPLNII